MIFQQQNGVETQSNCRDLTGTTEKMFRFFCKQKSGIQTICRTTIAKNETSTTEMIFLWTSKMFRCHGIDPARLHRWYQPLTHMLHVWNIYHHLPHKWPKCR